jgi:hypothetical protein
LGGSWITACEPALTLAGLRGFLAAFGIAREALLDLELALRTAGRAAGSCTVVMTATGLRQANMDRLSAMPPITS